MADKIVFDIETQNTFSEVDNDMKKLKISVVSVYSYEKDSYQSFSENELKELWPILEKADLIIGYNSEHFDLPVLNNYYLGDLSILPHLDLLKRIRESLGVRLKLDDVASATLDINKSADGLQAVRWFKEGKIEKYCEKDVEVTKKLYDFGFENKQLFYKNLTGEVTPFAIDFSFKEKIGDGKMKTVNFTLPL